MSQKILVVDDDPDIREVLTAVLETEGYQVVTAGDGIEGLATLKAERPDLMILDLLMPKMDGYAVCKELKDPRWAKYAKIPILVLTSVTFSLFGFIIGVWAEGFEKLQIIPVLIITPLTFLGGTFYTINMLPPFWQKVSLLNPVVYLISGFRWSFYETADVSLGLSLFIIFLFLAACILLVKWIFKTGYRLKS